MSQMMELPFGKGAAVGTLGVHVTIAVGGRPVISHVAELAELGPLLVQVTLPVTVLPAGAVVGRLIVTAISALTSFVMTQLIWSF